MPDATKEDRTVSIRSEDTILARYRAETEASKPHVESLALPPGVEGAGQNLVLTAPHDHKWHFGLFFCQKLIDGISCWKSEALRRENRLHGWAESKGYEVTQPDESDSSVRIRQDVAWNASDGEHLLDDERQLVVHSPTDDAYLLEWKQELDAVGHRRRLGSETISGRYSGLSLRFQRSFRDGRIRLPDVDSGATPVEDLNGMRARWCDYTGPLDGFLGARDAPTAGITVFDHPSNDPHPTNWYLMNDPFGFVAANPTWNRIETLDPREPVTWRWGVYVHGGTPAVDRIEEAYDRFVARS